MPSYHIKHIAQFIKCEKFIKQDSVITQLLTDSRQLHVGQETLFIAIKGEQHDGHIYIPELIRKGVANFVVEKIPHLEGTDNINYLLVKNSVQALQEIAGFHRSNFHFPVIGITGSNGKTIVKEWLYQSLHQRFNIVRSPKSYNSQIGVPLSLWNIEQHHNLGIFEAGISQIDEMDKLANIIRPDIGIITNIGEAHQQNFESYKEKTREKLRLFKKTSTIIYCKDNKYIQSELNGKNVSTLFTWSEKTGADLQIIKKTNQEKFVKIEATHKNAPCAIEVPFFDKASIENTIFVWCSLLYLGIDHETIQQEIKKLTKIEMRLEQKNGMNGCTIINDSYNSDMNSLTIALEYLHQQKQNPKKTVILSDILQSATPSQALYKEVSGLEGIRHAHRFIGIGQALYENKNLFKPGSLFYYTTDEFMASFDLGKFQNEAILLKGSRSFQFEKISRLLENKKNRTVLEINLNALTHNLNYFKSLLGEKTKIMVMVKALSYGSGTYEIANLLEYHRVDYFGVAIINEGISLRQAGIKTPIMVMNPEISDLELLVEYNLEPEIYSFEILHQFIRILQTRGIENYPCHLKFDTGMHRLGFHKNDVEQVVRIVKENQAIKIKSVFSHLAASDDPAFDDFTSNQINKYKKITRQIEQHLNYSFIKHILNSSGISRFPNARFDMVRLGIGLYGFAMKDFMDLRNVATFKTCISQIKDVARGETVGYNPISGVEKTTKIGVVPVGYADGLNRKLGNLKGKVMINGELTPIIGNICMDMCMINLDGINAREGDEVIIFGDNYPLTHIAEELETIPYEILTSISARVQRIYYSE